MKYAVQGCGHGQLNEIYAKIIDHNENLAEDDEPITLLMVCGDFQAIRNQSDLDQLACPPQYRHMGDFNLYWKGEKAAPILTIFIGGNHEAAGHMFSLYYGGWVAKNIYYLGHSSVIRIILEDGSSLKIASVSGIHSEFDVLKPYWEADALLSSHPHSSIFQKAVRSSYHTRLVEIEKLSLYNKIKSLRDTSNANETSIFLSHEWPVGIIDYGDKERLFKIKSHFQKDYLSIGSPNLKRLLEELQPALWYSAHMHVRFVAEYKNPATNNITDFLGLDKCHPKRPHDHLEFCKIQCTPQRKPLILQYDPQWLSVLRHYALNEDKEGEVDCLWVNDNIKMLEIPSPSIIPSPELQTDEFCQMLQIPNTISPIIINPSRID